AVALIDRHTHDGVRADASAALAAIALRASVTVGACSAVDFGRRRTHSRCWNAHARVVALIGRGAGDRVRTRTAATLATIGLGASVAIIARCAVRLRR